MPRETGQGVKAYMTLIAALLVSVVIVWATRKIMASLTILTATIAALGATVTQFVNNVQADVTALKGQIADLQSKLAASGDPAIQAQIDAANATLASLEQKLTDANMGVAADLTPAASVAPAPTEAPVPVAAPVAPVETPAPTEAPAPVTEPAPVADPVAPVAPADGTQAV